MFKKIAILGGSVLAAGSVFADGDITSTLQTAVTGSLTSIGTAIGVILVACLGVATGFVVYRLVKKAFTKAG